MEYKILAHSDFHKLEISVIYYIKNGWRPQGGVSTVHRLSIRETAFYQAMTRIENEKS